MLEQQRQSKRRHRYAHGPKAGASIFSEVGGHTWLSMFTSISTSDVRLVRDVTCLSNVAYDADRDKAFCRTSNLSLNCRRSLLLAELSLSLDEPAIRRFNDFSAGFDVCLIS